jgi:tRNA threonylcarbamoyladenosine biosynthesis protein TsaB
VEQVKMRYPRKIIIFDKEFPLIHLALETSGLTFGVAIFDDDRLLEVGESAPSTRTAAGLVPLVRDVLKRAQVALPDVRLISLPVGPGSFTGLRVGVTTAKTLAYALGSDVLGLDTLDVIAAQSRALAAELWAVVDAQRQQLFVRHYVHGPTGWNSRGDSRIVDIDEFVRGLSPGVIVIGPGLAKIAALIPSSVTIADATLWKPHARTVGRLALAKYKSGARGDLWQLVPHYFRPSAAEEKRDKLSK